MQLEEFTDFIHLLAKKSGEVIKPYFARADLAIDIKKDQTIVTQADREAEAVMRDLIRKRYPHHGILGEEFGSDQDTAEFVWILDPIDGTISFASGCPLFGTLIGLLHRRKPILGAICNPILDQLCIGNTAETRLNGRIVQLRKTRLLSDAMLLTTDIKDIARYQHKAGFDKLLGDTRLFRTWGDCYGYLMVATGSADIMIDPVVNPWDILPIIPIIQGAKGVVTTWTGTDAASGNSCVAANGTLHPQILKILNA